MLLMVTSVEIAAMPSSKWLLTLNNPAISISKSFNFLNKIFDKTDIYCDINLGRLLVPEDALAARWSTWSVFP